MLVPSNKTKIVTADQMRLIEKKSEQSGVSTDTLIKNAGLEIAKHIKNNFKSNTTLSVIILVGTGNNGGDGFVTARHLMDNGYSVEVYVFVKEQSYKGDALKAFKEYNLDLKKSYVIGDRYKDINAGRAANCKTILIDRNYNEKIRKKPLFVVNNFKEISKIFKF